MCGAMGILLRLEEFFSFLDGYGGIGYTDLSRFEGLGWMDFKETLQ